MGDDGGHSGFGQGRGGNDGMSGAPMWQIKRKMAQYEAQRENLVQELIRENEEKKRVADPPNVLVDAIASGQDSKTKPLVRHVLVKDLNRIAQMKGIEFPTSDIFQGKAPIGLYALFDGQSCTGAPGPAAAEFCARNLHTKVMENLVMLKQGSGTEPFIKAAIIKSFHDLDADYLAQMPEVQDGCGAAMALFIGSHIFVATLGRCTAVLAEAPEDGSSKPRPHTLVGGGQPQATAVAALLGEPARKSGAGGVAPLSCTPEVHGVALKHCSKHPFLILGSSTMSAVLDTAKIVEYAADYNNQPRFACGELLARATEAHAAVASQGAAAPQLVCAQLCFLPPKEKAPEKSTGSEPAAKKAKPGTKEALKSVRLRHILLRTQDAPQAKQAAAKGKAAKPRAEAEGLLRNVLNELSKDLQAAKKAPKTPNDLVLFQGKKFAEFCRKISHCPTAQKGGSMCGDLGWVTMQELTNMGGQFREKCEALAAGQWSDVCSSDQGVHLVQRVA